MNHSNDNSLKTCKYCQTEISRKARICPNCHKKQGIHKWIPLIVFFIIIFGICYTLSNDPEYNNDNKFSYVVTKEYDDYFSHYIEGTVTNNLDKDYSYVQIEFVCYDKDGNNVGTAFDNTNNLLKKQTWKFKALGLFTDTSVDHCDFQEISGW